MIRHGLQIGSTLVGQYPAFAFYGRITSNDIIDSSKGVVIDTSSFNNPHEFNVTAKLIRIKLPSAEYVVFSRDLSSKLIYTPFHDDKPTSNQYQNPTTNSLKISLDGNAFLTAIFENNSKYPAANTEFYIFKKTTFSDQNQYGLSVFNESGQITYTSSGEPLFINSSVELGDAPHFIDPDTAGVLSPHVNTGRNNLAVLNSASWFLTNEDFASTEEDVCYLKFGLSINIHGLLSTSLQSMSPRILSGFYPAFGDPQISPRAKLIDVSRLQFKNTLHIK